MAMTEGNFKRAHELMPTTFKEVFEQPKVFEQVIAIGERAVLRQIEFELIQLSLLVSVGGNLTDAQVPFVARNLMAMYPKESIADFRLCFERGAMGRYGPMQRLDGATIGEWMPMYLDEKYTSHENVISVDKKKPTEFEVLADEGKINDYLKQIGDNAKNAKIQNVMELTDKEIRKFGKEKPVVGNAWKPMTEGELRAYELHNQWIRENFDPYTGHKLPTWISEEEFLKREGKI